MKLVSILIGMIIPFVAIVGVLPFIASSDASILGFPIIYFWIFLWLPLTSLCLWLSWLLYDRHNLKKDL